MNNDEQVLEVKKVDKRHREGRVSAEAAFIRDIHEHPLTRRTKWTLNELVELHALAENGDEEALHALACSAACYMAKLANAYRPRTGEGVSLGDLYSVGYEALYHAAEKYQPGRGLLFTTYAHNWVIQYMNRYLNANGRTVRVPDKRMDELKKFNKTHEELVQKLGRQPTFVEVATASGFELDEADDIRTFSSISFSLHASGDSVDAGEEDNNLAGDLFERTLGVTPESIVSRMETCAELMRALDELTDLERQILTARFGLDGDEPMEKRSEVCRAIGASPHVVKNAEARAFEKLRAKLSREDFFVH